MTTIFKKDYPNGIKAQIHRSDVLDRFFTVITNPLQGTKAMGNDFETETDAKKHVETKVAEISKQIEAKKEQERHYWFQDI